MKERAVIDPHFMKVRRLWANCAYVFFISGGFIVLIYYISIYFQSVKGLSPIQSGVRSLPLSIGCFLTIVAGFLVTTHGRIWAPLMAFGSAVATVGGGLIYTLDVDTSGAKYIGYQVIVSAGFGLAIQIPLMANQAFVAPRDVSTVSAITMFFQIIGGSFSVACAQAAFVTTLVRRIAVLAPEVDPEMLLNLGAAQLHDKFTGSDYDAVLRAYMDGLQIAFAVASALLEIGFLLALIPKWDSLRPREETSALNHEGKSATD